MFASSPVLKEMLSKNPSQHPIIFITDIKIHILRSLLQYIYLGEVQIEKSDLVEFMRAADAFKVKGLQHKEQRIPHTYDDTAVTPQIVGVDVDSFPEYKRPKLMDWAVMDAAPSTSKAALMDPLSYQAEFSVDTEPNETNLTAIMEKFKTYLLESTNGVEIFSEYTSQGSLGDERKEQLVQLMCDFVQRNYQNNYSQVKREVLSEVVQCMFPGTFTEPYTALAELIHHRIGNFFTVDESLPVSLMFKSIFGNQCSFKVYFSHAFRLIQVMKSTPTSSNLRFVKSVIFV